MPRGFALVIHHPFPTFGLTFVSSIRRPPKRQGPWTAKYELIGTLAMLPKRSGRISHRAGKCCGRLCLKRTNVETLSERLQRPIDAIDLSGVTQLREAVHLLSGGAHPAGQF